MKNLVGKMMNAKLIFVGIVFFICNGYAGIEGHGDVHGADVPKEVNHAEDDHDHQHAEQSDHRGEDNHAEHEKEHESHGEHDDHDEHGDSGFGEGKAITDVKNEGEKFKLAKEAQDLMGLKYAEISVSNTTDTFTVPTRALIFFNDEKGVFVKDDEWFQLIEVKIIKSGLENTQVVSKKLALGKKIVIAGTGLLRVAHLQASGQGGEGHAH